MTDPKKSWDAYWQGTGSAGAYSSGGAGHPAFAAYWNEVFQLARQNYQEPLILDIASGNGAVVEQALQHFGDRPARMTCTDLSGAAISNIQNRFPQVKGVVADARDIPLDSGAFDLITSQFGIEYAGLQAIAEAERLLAPGGRLALLMHIQGGAIQQECLSNLDAVSRVQESGFVERASEMFRAGFEAVRGADRKPYEEAAKRLAPAIQALEAVMKQHGEHVADDTVAKLYGDVGTIHSELQQYDPDEVLGWLGRMDGELDAYSGRMSSMRDAATDEESFKKVVTGLQSQGFTIESAGPFQVPDNELPLAWALIAKK